MSTVPETIVLVHGLWLTPLSWERWIERYESKGFNVLAPAWPGMDGDVADVRRDPAPYARLGVGEIADYYERIIRELERPPIIMGHSFGGAITEILLDRGLGGGGVAISPPPVKGSLAIPPSALRVASVALRNPSNRHKAVTLTPKEFQYGFTNTLTEEESQQAYDRYAVPGPGRVLFQAAFSNVDIGSPLKVHPGSGRRAPLLLMANGRDHTVPASLTKSAYKIQRKASSPTELKEYPERSHWTVSLDGWEQVADEALGWATEHARPPLAA
jgi:non-heme chloroperoxidase